MTAAAQQVLDIGDQVRPADQRIAGAIAGLCVTEPLTVIEVLAEPDMYRIRNPDGLIVTGGRPGMERIGGDLQPGDWVRVTGKCKTVRGTDREDIEDEVGLIVDTYEEEGGPDFLVCIRGLADLYECRTPQLTRITRAEALA